MKREYWENKRTKRTHPDRNYIHIRIVGEDKALCGRDLNPEFDEKQAKNWERTDTPNRKKICKHCAKVSKKMTDPRDKTLISAKKTLTRTNPMPKNKEVYTELEDLEEMLEEELNLENFAESLTDQKENALSLLNTALEELSACSTEEEAEVFCRISQLKRFILACEKLGVN